MPEACFVYLRETDDQRRLIALNFSGDEHTLDLSAFGDTGTPALSTYLQDAPPVDLSRVTLRPHEGIIF